MDGRLLGFSTRTSHHTHHTPQGHVVRDTYIYQHAQPLLRTLGLRTRLVLEELITGGTAMRAPLSRRAHHFQ